MSIALCDELQAILLEWNGRLIGTHVHLYSLTDLAERNRTFETALYCPGFIAIGSDGGGRSVMCDPYTTGPIYLVDDGVMQQDFFVQVADDLSLWIKDGCPL